MDVLTYHDHRKGIVPLSFEDILSHRMCCLNIHLAWVRAGAFACLENGQGRAAVARAARTRVEVSTLRILMYILNWIVGYCVW